MAETKEIKEKIATLAQDAYKAFAKLIKKSEGS